MAIFLLHYRKPIHTVEFTASLLAAGVAEVSPGNIMERGQQLRHESFLQCGMRTCELTHQSDHL